MVFHRGHPPNSIQVCPVTQVKLWRIRVQERRKGGNGEKLEGWKLKKTDETRYIKVHSFFSLAKLQNPHLKIRPIAIFAFYSLNYSLAARLQDNSRPKLPTKEETKKKLQQFTVSGWLIINGERVIGKKEKTLGLKSYSI